MANSICLGVLLVKAIKAWYNKGKNRVKRVKPINETETKNKVWSMIRLVEALRLYTISHFILNFKYRLKNQRQKMLSGIILKFFYQTQKSYYFHSLNYSNFEINSQHYFWYIMRLREFSKADFK